MNSFYGHHRDSIRWQYRCFDRILLNGLIQPFQQPERVVGFFNTYRQLYPVSRHVLRDIADQFGLYLAQVGLKVIPNKYIQITVTVVVKEATARANTTAAVPASADSTNADSTNADGATAAHNATATSCASSSSSIQGSAGERETSDSARTRLAGFARRRERKRRGKTRQGR